MEALELLRDALAANQTLELFHFEENFIGDEGAEIFASMDADAKKNLNVKID